MKIQQGIAIFPAKFSYSELKLFSNAPGKFCSSCRCGYLKSVPNVSVSARENF